MRVFSKLHPLGMIAIVAFPLAGCSADGFKDMVGLSKSSPDETLVATSRPLALPPDYALKPPVQAAAPAAVAPAPAPVPTQTASLQKPAAAPSPLPEAGSVDAPAVTGSVNPTAISKTNPDGTPKSAKQIREEARQAKIAQEKAKNPNYGTWKNLLGALWD